MREYPTSSRNAFPSCTRLLLKLLELGSTSMDIKRPEKARVSGYWLYILDA